LAVEVESSTLSVTGATPSEDGRFAGVFGRIIGPSAVANPGLVFGLSRVNATGAELGSVVLDDSMSVSKRLKDPHAMSTELPVNITVMTAADANIATTAIVSLVATDMVFLSVAAVAMVLAPLAVEAPVKRAAWTAIASTRADFVHADFILIGCTMVGCLQYAFSVDLMRVVTPCNTLYR
jgi:hypothetical protein